jgi:hypothetical protein
MDEQALTFEVISSPVIPNLVRLWVLGFAIRNAHNSRKYTGENAVH